MSEFENQKIIPVEIVKEMKKSYIDYAMSVIVSRALPDVRDGLKPVHRRILYTMHESGLYPDKGYRKCATTVGDVLGKYHPHGDAAVYDSMVRMAQDFSLRYPLVDGHGNFGSVDGDPAAAYRYTESKMAKLSVQMLRDIEKETVDFTPNYDERLKEPVVLPARFPQLLVNGSSGIAVGMATNVPPHNLKEVIDGVIALIDNPDITIEELMEYIKGPDFPTSGVIMGMSGIRSAYTTGRGKIIIRAKAEIEEDGNRQKIIVTEIPYQVNKARLIEKIADLVKDKRLEGISDLRDESDRDGMRIVIELKRDANASIVLNNLYKFTQMQETFGVIMLALVDNKPAILNLKEVLEHYLKFQEDVIVRRTKFDLRKAEARAHILEGLRIALDNIDEIIRVIRSSYNDAKEKLCERFGLSEIQAQAILDMRLARLQGLERDKIDQEYAELEEKIAYYKKILSDEGMVLDIIKDELNEIKDKYGDERRTSISFDYSEIDMEDLIDEEDVVITLTHFGYVKRLKTDTYRAQRRGGRGISGLSTREEDFVEELFVTSTHNYILFFTNMGRMFKLKAYQIPEASRTAKGMAIVNLLELEANEKITATIPLKEFEDGKYLTMVTRKGTIKKTGLMEYNTNRSGGLRAIGLEEDDELIRVKLTDGTRDIIIGTHKGMAIRFNEQDVRPMGRTAHGVRGIKLKDNDYVVGASLVSEGVDLLIVSENGMGKRTNVDEYKVQQRGGKGVKTYKITEKTGDIAGIKTIDDNHDIMLITSDGVVIRTGANEISTLGRDTSGVRLMRLAEDIKVVAIARIDKEEEDVTDDAETELSDGQKEEIAETEE
ncbi:DNA gyrase subunit A [Acetivibrio sp. MSJd-27]|jgi:DNA gyrase, A subunit|uniref:DNA gyrase subunit A n=1 Tax=Acetivibrio sp. MSJd-27 TaxID=2841523 RepID=UPI001C0F631A|nr:DNA gyrase subunit A [Acetivibrio sp. MSJd-27]MBU5449269.1 DNA gyrase subunit A [Acetivibrio sp. MSJd-27]